MEETTAEKLLQRIHDRDSEALAEYLHRHRSRLAGFLKSITSEHLLARVGLDDLIQEVWTAALTALPTAQLHEGDLFGWIQELARRRVIDAHRYHFKAQRRDAGRERSLQAPAGDADSSALGLEDLLAASMTTPSAALSHVVRLARIQEAISAMSAEQREVIRMRYVDGLPTKEIAEKLGKTDVAVRVLLSRSMRKLEQQLEDVRPTR